MHRLIVSLIFVSTALFGAYDIKIGVYKNEKNLRENIKKIKHTKYRKSIIIEKKNNLYYAHAVMETNKDAKNAVNVYKRIFKDAFIAKEQVKSLKPVKKVAPPTPKPTPKPEQKVKKEEPKEKLFSKALFANKKIYLCYEKGVEVMKKRVVQLDFKKEHVKYTPLEAKKKSIDIKYTFVQDNIVYPMSNLLVTHKFFEKKKDYISGKSYINGKEAHALRYYFDKKSALAFVESK
jgi:hypothetical protein